jgi:hypothetical protein
MGNQYTEGEIVELEFFQEYNFKHKEKPDETERPPHYEMTVKIKIFIFFMDLSLLTNIKAIRIIITIIQENNVLIDLSFKGLVTAQIKH